MMYVCSCCQQIVLATATQLVTAVPMNNKRPHAQWRTPASYACRFITDSPKQAYVVADAVLVLQLEWLPLVGVECNLVAQRSFVLLLGSSLEQQQEPSKYRKGLPAARPALS
jgi:hypothetical protein